MGRGKNWSHVGRQPLARTVPTGVVTAPRLEIVTDSEFPRGPLLPRRLPSRVTTRQSLDLVGYVFGRSAGFSKSKGFGREGSHPTPTAGVISG
jgi:hypothetical protein